MSQRQTADDERSEYGHRFAVMNGQDGPGDSDSGRAHYAASDKNRLDWLVEPDNDIVSTTTSRSFSNTNPGSGGLVTFAVTATDPDGNTTVTAAKAGLGLTAPFTNLKVVKTSG